MTRPRPGVALLAAALVSLAACGSDTSGDPGTTTEGTAGAATDATTAATGADDGGADAVAVTAEGVDAADVEFVLGMIPHHAQALEMAQLAPERASDPAVVDLAARIEAEQEPEIEQMRTWLRSWGVDEPGDGSTSGTDGMDGMDGMDHGGEGGADDGMLSADELDELAAADGADFDRRFTAGMIRHHEGAIAMAETVMADGSDPDVRSLAEGVVAAQSAEIEELRALEAGFGS